MFSITIKADPAFATRIERLSREVESGKSIIAFMLENDKPINTDSFKDYKKEYEETFAEFDKAKTEFQTFTIPEKILTEDGANTTWNLDFATQMVTITYKGNKFTEEEFKALFK